MNATTCSIDGVAATRTVRGPEDNPRVRSNDMVSGRVKRVVKVWRICEGLGPGCTALNNGGSAVSSDR